MRSRLSAARRRARIRIGQALAADALSPFVRITDDEKRQMASFHDDSVPLPPEAAELGPDHPRLAELRARYAALDLPVLEASRWNEAAVDGFLDHRYFRGDTLITWHYRELPRISRLKYFVWLEAVAARDPDGYLDRLGEDGLFGCWTYAYPGRPTVSRDLLESVGELAFLDRALEQPPARVLDIGAGYGRLAYRMTTAHREITDYCCVDAIADSTFLSEFYLRFRGCDRARVVALDEVGEQLEGARFDLAVNIHSFSECTHAAISWWVDLLTRLEVPRLLIVPNEATELLSLEADGSRRDFAPLLERAGYRLERREPVIADPAARELLALDDHFHLFTRA